MSITLLSTSLSSRPAGAPPGAPPKRCIATAPLHAAAAFALFASCALQAQALIGPECLDDVGQLQAEAPQRGALNIDYFEWKPAVMPYDRPLASPMVFTVHLTGGASGARLTLSGGGGTIALNDLGQAPDVTAGDEIFSGNVPVQTVLDRNTAERVHRPIIGQVQGLDAGNPAGPLINVLLPVMPAEARTIPVTTISATARRTPWLLNIRDDAYVNDNGRERVSMAGYAHVPDAYEFVHYVNAPRSLVQNRFHGAIRNSVTGIGLAAINAGASYGSPATLIGFTVFPNLSFYDMHGPGVLHETGHQWINFLTGATFGDPRGGAHWPISSIANNVMGFSLAGGPGGSLNCQLTTNGSSITTQLVTSSRYYHPWELYMMGFQATVPNAFTVTDQTAALNLINGNPGWCNGSTYNLATTSLTQALLQGSFGVRSPSAATSRKYFHVLTLVVSNGRTLGDDELRYISFMTARAQTAGVRPWAEGLTGGDGPQFFEATGGRGTLDFRLDGTFAGGFEGN